MNIMVLGAGGYLGKKICNYLESAENNIVRVIRRKDGADEIEGRNIVYADIAAIRQELGKVSYDWVINCAAVYERGITKLHEVVDANLVFAVQVLDCAVECGVKNFLTIDTSLPKELNLYSFTKKQFAEFGDFYAEKYGITFLNVVLEMFYGEDEPEDRFLVDCCHKMLAGETLLLTEGTQERDIIYITDVCAAIKLLLNADMPGFHNIPVGSGCGVSVRKLLEYMHNILKSESELNFGAVPLRKNEPDCVADISILKGLGFEVKYPWKEGIEYFCKRIVQSKNNSL